MKFKDHFSGHARNYSLFRPSYPDQLYDWLYDQLDTYDLAWDCGTGNGQVALELAKKFRKVIATDASSQQIEHAIPHPGVEYHVSHAENSFLQDRSVDLVTVGQALHWFNFDEFFKETERVLKPGGLFACWTYKFLTIDEPLDEILRTFFDVIESYWPKERDHVEADYATIPFPAHYQAVSAPFMFIERPMNAEEVLNYLRTWSAVKNYKNQHNGNDPLAIIESDFFRQWGLTTALRNVKHPLVVKAFRI